jgi:hypothetical protein
MNSLCILPSGKRKIWDTGLSRGLVPASQAYTRGFASTAQECAQIFYPESWIVLSTNYGFLFWPTGLVERQYNVSFSRRCDSVTRDVDLCDQVNRLGLSQFGEIVVIAATAYAAAVHRAFADRSVRIRSPPVGLPNMGSMIGQMNKAIAARIAF